MTEHLDTWTLVGKLDYFSTKILITFGSHILMVAITIATSATKNISIANIIILK